MVKLGAAGTEYWSLADLEWSPAACVCDDDFTWAAALFNVDFVEEGDCAVEGISADDRLKAEWCAQDADGYGNGRSQSRVVEITFLSGVRAVQSLKQTVMGTCLYWSLSRQHER